MSLLDVWTFEQNYWYPQFPLGGASLSKNGAAWVKVGDFVRALVRKVLFFGDVARSGQPWRCRSEFWCSPGWSIWNDRSEFSIRWNSEFILQVWRKPSASSLLPRHGACVLFLYQKWCMYILYVCTYIRIVNKTV